jgi:hypothetical protein
MSSYLKLLERLAIAVLLLTVCSGHLADVLPRLVEPLAVLVGLAIAVRIVWHITDRY